MKLYNSLSRKIEEFVPRGSEVGVYTCGPTVYNTATIGNFRTYTFADLLVRSLKFAGYKTKYVMNITDVGHLTGDNEGDASQGDDRLEKAAKKEGRTAWDIAASYTAEFLEHAKLLNIAMPDVLCKATDHIAEQIEMVKKLETKGFTYKIADGIYFDVAKFESMGFRYGELSTLDQIQFGARLEPNPEKRDPRDFALWKFSPSGERRHMEWDSPWGVGFPGWHIECSAMSTKYLGEQFDIHVGGEDLRSTHHPNEIAQAEGATGKRPFVKYWMHGAFLLVDGGRMGKSLGNAYTVADIIAKGYDPLALRYFYMSSHYRKQANFTWDALSAANTALKRLRAIYVTASEEQERTSLSQEKLGDIDTYMDTFRTALANDIDMPTALSIVWEVAKSNIPGGDKRDLLLSFDEVLGLRLAESKKYQAPQEIPEDIIELAKRRQQLRVEKKWQESDQVRDQLRQKGYEVEDLPDGTYSLRHV